ncbi:MAG: YidC/Oxa1 family membrane protein insertase [Chloroflexota bacterium]
MKIRNRTLLFLLLLVTMTLLSGCGVPADGVDIATQDPEGLWQTIAVWPLARSLIALDGFLQSYDIPYHWGFAIIVFTLIVKALTFPLTLTQIRGMQAQKDIQPKVQALQKKFGNDREKLAQEQMKLYREAGVNPLSGCLPLLVQMPILFGLYSALVALGPTIENSRFFWIPDLGFPRYTEGLNWIMDDFNGGQYGHLAAYLVLPIVLVASQYAMQKWMTPATPPPADGGTDQAAMMRQVGTMMTFMFGFFTLQVPAGLSLYWVTSNLIQVAQQVFITRRMAESKGIGGQYVAEATDGANAINATDVAAISVNGSGSNSGEAGTTQQNNSSVNAKTKNNSGKKKSGKRRSKRKR